MTTIIPGGFATLTVNDVATDLTTITTATPGTPCQLCRDFGH
ncbi:enoyl-CoA hydratase, partial [Corynebacterium sanguinis]